MIKQETQADGTVVNYTYDAIGNLLSKSVTKNGNTTTTNYQYDAANELTSVGGQVYTYDKNGNLTNDGKYTYKWNELGELTEVDNASTGSTVATYTYDALNRRVSETTSSGTTDFVYEGTSDLVAYETDGSGNLERSYTYNDQEQPVTLTTWSGGTGTTYYYQLDGQGDVVGLTDSTGQSVASYTYDAWGNILSKTGSLDSVNPYLYRGYRWDSTVGLYYLNARYYSPETMRFISADPDASSANLYVYADDNPVNEVDPSGEFVANIIGAVIGAGGGAILGLEVANYYHITGWKRYLTIAGFTVGGGAVGWFAGPLVVRMASSLYPALIRVVPEVANCSRNTIEHIMLEKHDWYKVVKDGRSWKQISRVISYVMKNGKKARYGSAWKKTAKVGKEMVTVTFQYVNGKIRISDAWVNR